MPGFKGRTTMEKPRDVFGGLIVVAIGSFFLILGRDLEMGTSLRMGPGYFPIILSAMMICLGAVMTYLAWKAKREEGAFSHIPWLGLLLVVGSVVFFGFTVRSLGLFAVVAILVFLTARASQYATWRGSVLLALGISTLCTVLFIHVLGLPLQATGPWLSTSYWSGPAESLPPTQ
jgi:Tripartite tricarboxylate transporter TctB family